MNLSFYQQILAGDASQISDDQDNVVWVDWGDEEDAIVEAIRDHLEIDGLHATTNDAENDHGYVVEISFKGRTATIDPTNDFDCRHATLNAVDAILPDHQLRFATPTNGGDTIAIAIELISDWDSLYTEFGKPLNQIFCPIQEIPDLMNTPGNEIDDACAAYADRIG